MRLFLLTILLAVSGCNDKKCVRKVQEDVPQAQELYKFCLEKAAKIGYGTSEAIETCAKMAKRLSVTVTEVCE